MNDIPAVVLDCGSSWCRAGFSSTSSDSKKLDPAVFRNVIGYPRTESVSGKDLVFGDAALSQRQNVKIRYPYQFGYIACWEDVELVWQTLITDRLKAKPEDHPFLIILTGSIPRLTFEKTAEIFFEQFDVPALSFRSSGELSLLSSGRTTGTVVEIGGGACFPVPVVEGYELRYAKQRTEFSGNNLTGALSRMILKSKETETDTLCMKDLDFENINTIKEKYCYCAENYEKELEHFTKDKEVIHHINDKSESSQVINLGPELFQCPEALFKPHLAKQEFPGLHEIVFKCIKPIDNADVQKELFSNVMLCGGSSFFPGLASRLQQELYSLSTSKGCDSNVSVSLNPYRHAAFEGGKMAACQENFSKRSFTREEYDNQGPFSISFM